MPPSQKPVDIRTELSRTLFGMMGEDVLNRVSAAARVENYSSSCLLDSAGVHHVWLRYVRYGYIETIARSRSGEEVVVTEIGPRSWTSWLACFMKTPPGTDFYCSESASFIAIPVRLVRELCLEYPELSIVIIQEIGERMRRLLDWTGQSVLLSPDQRMAKLILLQAQMQGVQGNSGIINTTQSRLARMGRCTRQTAAHLLATLEVKGLIRKAYGKFEVGDFKALAAFAEKDNDTPVDIRTEGVRSVAETHKGPH